MILHTVSIWYTLVLAVWRLIMIKFHTIAVTSCTMRRCWVLLVLGYGENIEPPALNKTFPTDQFFPSFLFPPIVSSKIESLASLAALSHPYIILNEV